MWKGDMFVSEDRNTARATPKQLNKEIRNHLWAKQKYFERNMKQNRDDD